MQKNDILKLYEIVNSFDYYFQYPLSNYFVLYCDCNFTEKNIERTSDSLLNFTLPIYTRLLELFGGLKF